MSQARKEEAPSRSSPFVGRPTGKVTTRSRDDEEEGRSVGQIPTHPSSNIHFVIYTKSFGFAVRMGWVCARTCPNSWLIDYMNESHNTS